MPSPATADSGKSSILRQVSAAFLRGWVAWIQEWLFLKRCPWSATWVCPGEVLLGSLSCGEQPGHSQHNSNYSLVLVLWWTLLPRWGFLTWFELLLPLVTSLLSPSVGTVAAPGGEMWLFVFFSRVSFGHSALFMPFISKKSFLLKKIPSYWAAKHKFLPFSAV